MQLHPAVRRDGLAVVRGPSVRVLGWLAAIGIGGSLFIMIAASVIRPDWMSPPVAMPSSGPPWQAHVHIAPGLVVILLWLAVLMAVGGIVAGLVAARRGAHGPVRLILVGALLAVVVLALLPAVGSTDALDYAAYGRLTELGINPYVATPLYLRLTDPVFGASIPTHWEHQVSLYGPAATIEQFLAARLRGNSMAMVVLWLKVWNALAFAGVALLLDRVLRGQPAQRLRAHLLWTANPLLIWALIAGGHVDVLAAGAGLAGLLLAGRSGPDVRPVIWRALVGGALVGLAADIKIDYLLLGLGLAWALRRSLLALAAAAAGGLAILAPTYAWLGMPAFRALVARRDKTTQDSFYRFVAATDWKYLIVVAVVLFAARTILLLLRLPAGDPGRPAIAGPCPQRGLAVRLAVYAALVRRHDHLPPGALPGVAARLVRAGEACRDDARQHSGGSVGCARVVPQIVRRRAGARGGACGHAGRRRWHRADRGVRRVARAAVA